jgi:thiamine biosynthesis lipoprotein
MLSRRFHAMGTQIELLLDGEHGRSALGAAEDEFRRLEGLLSRFLPDSELSRLNLSGELVVGPELLELAELAVAARERTAGRFDPTVHDALAAAGYDRSFELVGVGATSVAPAVPARCGGGVTVDRTRSRVALEPGYALDLGGIAKGWAADRVLESLLPHGPALVDAGGDVAAAGRGWPVGVDTPEGTITIELRDGALATSGIDRRNWLQDGLFRHHLIDPATGLPAEGDLLSVTVAAPTAAEAEVLAKSLFLAATVDRAAAEAEEQEIPAVLVTRSGSAFLVGGLA